MAVPQFHRLTVREVRPETADAVSVVFEVPESLREAYRFRAGQFLTLRGTVDGEELRRSYSICVGEPAYLERGELRVAIKRVHAGRFSNWANDTLQPGQTLDVMTPDGRFVTQGDAVSRGRHVLGIAGGSGITPVLSLIETVLATEPHSHFTLIYGSRGVASILFLEALEALKNKHLTRLRLIHVLSDEDQEVELLSGLLDATRTRALLATLKGAGAIDEAFVCGPAPMMDAAEAALLEHGLPRERLRIERFGTPAPVAVKPAPVNPDAPQAQVVMILDGKSRNLQVPFDGPALLDAGLAVGAALPYACKSGVCCTCRARVLEGEVRMDRNDSLDAAEVAAGFVLTCQAHPVSARVVVSYDER